MKLKLLAAVASVAFVATGAAYAQDNANRDKHPEAQRNEQRAPAAAPQAAPRAAQAEPRREEPKAGQMETRQPGATPRNAQAEPRREEPKAGQMETRQPATAPRNAQTEPRREEPKTGQTEKPANAPRNAQGEMRREEPKTGQAETREPRNAQGEMRRDEKTGQGERQPGMGARTAQHQGAPRVQGRINVSTEHAARIGEVLRGRDGAERVNVSARIGERISTDIEIRPLPQEVISLAPEYQGYDYFVDSDDEIVFVSPESHEIVGMIDYGDNPQLAGARPCPVEN